VRGESRPPSCGQTPNAPHAKSAGLAKSDALRRIYTYQQTRILQEKPPKQFQIVHRKAFTELRCKSRREILKQLLSISCPSLPALFFFYDFLPNQPVRHYLRGVDGTRRTGPRSFKNPPDTIVD
jgi:hypothetical protein